MNAKIHKKLSPFGQYRKDIFTKLNYPFTPGKKILDVGCGDGIDGEIFYSVYGLKPYAIDVYEHEKIKEIKYLSFKKAGIYKIPYPDKSFDYIYLHDVLHHIDEKRHSLKRIIAALKELDRVRKKGGTIIIVEGNRYNPLFYPHMVKAMGHDHFSQHFFTSTISGVFPQAIFRTFESHLYPQQFLQFWKLYENIMENFIPKQFLAYNIAIIGEKHAPIKNK